MNARQEKLFKNIVEEYVKTAQPVGSKLVVEKYLCDVSPATVRNDMAELEDLGLIRQPHTSAGRIPTESGYKYYVDNYVDKKKKLNSREENELIKQVKQIKQVEEQKIKFLARLLADKSALGVFVGFSKNNVYYTGLANLFSHPEFQNLNLIYNLSSVVDHLDEVMQDIYDEINDIQIRIGVDNPFAHDCASVMIKVKDILFGIMGPMRMDYARNVSLINFIKMVISNW